MIDRNDDDWRQVTHEVKCDLAQRIFDARAGHTPSFWRKLLEHVVGAPFSRMLIVLNRRTGCVVDVEVISAERALGLAMRGTGTQPRAYC